MKNTYFKKVYFFYFFLFFLIPWIRIHKVVESGSNPDQDPDP
jgi:hypothetical protein